MTKLPDRWCSVRSGELFSLVTSGSRDWAKYYSQDGDLFVRMGNLDHDTISLDLVDVQRVSPPSNAEGTRTRVQAGDILISITADVGMVGLVPEALDTAYINQHLALARLKPGFLSAYIAWFLAAASGGQHQFHRLQRGATKKGLGLDDIRNVEIPLAPFPEQTRIVEAIESYFTQLDNAVATLERVQANLKRYRASVLKAAVEGRLVPTEAELARQEGRDYEPASELVQRILVERRRRWEEAELAALKTKGKAPKDDKWKAKYKEPVAPDATFESALPVLPPGWTLASMDQLTATMTSGSRDWTKYYDRGDGTFIMAQNVRPGRLDLSWRQAVDPPEGDSSRQRSQVEPGDLLVTIVGANTGDLCRVPSPLPEHYVCQSVALMRPTDPSLSVYLDLYLNSPLGRSIYGQYMYGEGRPHLSFDQLRAAPILVPPLAEQERIVAAAERSGSFTDDVARTIVTSALRCGRLRQSILRWAFEGKLAQQDPNDEPASVLLERLKAEREVKAVEARLKTRVRRNGRKRSAA